MRMHLTLCMYLCFCGFPLYFPKVVPEFPKNMGQINPRSCPNKHSPMKTDVACIHDVPICHIALPQNMPNNYYMTIVDVTVVASL